MTVAELENEALEAAEAPEPAEEPAKAPEVQETAPDAVEPASAPSVEPGPSMEEYRDMKAALAAMSQQIEELRTNPPSVPVHIGEGRPVGAASGAEAPTPPQSQAALFRTALNLD
ncbi:hypothetical protein OG389_06030 [Streptomyces sp. NBC_00435]|uniref:hypothetical protein n=1 Tax=Streptomyces sp. NBC_00435 TaxID=2903649 RepID=UPI002E211322